MRVVRPAHGRPPRRSFAELERQADALRSADDALADLLLNPMLVVEEK